MKKEVIFLVIFLLFILIIPLAHAQITDTIDDISETKDELTESGKELLGKTTTADYLKREWNKIFEKNPVGRVILKISDFFELFNPFYKSVLGVEYSLSWAFVFAVIIWLTLFLFLINPAGAIFNNKIYGVVAAFIITCLIGINGVIKNAVDVLSTMINNTWIFWLSLFITLVIALIMYKLGIITKEKIEKMKKESEEEQLKKAREMIKLHGKVSEKELKGGK